ncbi:Nucleotidyltransferase [Rhizopus microsporus ATCC 52813]|uniref:polynucleotide adenylyltransferase n=1 Tax=Rhizopus microsporus ATCC 52813 TaxID=1340429 RepID=A0A2G4T3W1_RHIZD|nr:Nucleotidyltransferase [Rhizopus microsporus ATCC 52813]PHZ15376.1 Nucleotidyltransferase [Rhizopus microsporus ATCC 52813]
MPHHTTKSNRSLGSSTYDLSVPPTTLPFYDSLSFDLLDVYNTLLPSRASYDQRQLFISKIRNILKTEWPDYETGVHVFGSSINGLSMEQSDVDLCITCSKLTCIYSLSFALKKHGLQIVKLISNAKVPIAKVWDPELHIAGDFNLNNTLALQNTKMIKTYVSIDPRVRPLILFIKHWAKQRNINDAAQGGTISTYTWVCMAINFLQTRQPPILPSLHEMPHSLSEDNQVIHGLNTSFCDNPDQLRGYGRANRETLGGLLYAFFRRYGFEFDYRSQVISVRSGKVLSRQEKGWHKGPESQQLLCVEEPFDVHRNLGNSANEEAVHGLILEFQRAVHIILETHGNLDYLCTSYQQRQIEYLSLQESPVCMPLPSQGDKRGRLAI